MKDTNYWYKKST